MSADLRFILAKEIFLKCQPEEWSLSTSDDNLRGHIVNAFNIADDFISYAKDGEFISNEDDDSDESEDE